MKRHLQIEPTDLNLSVEEEAILLDEQSQISAELNELDADATRIIDMNVIINDTTQVISGLPEVNGVEADLVAAVSEMAVAGTDADPDDILSIPANGLSAEGFLKSVGDTLTNIWNAIKTAIAKMYEHLKKFFANFSLRSSMMKSKMSAASDKRKELDKKIETIKKDREDSAEKIQTIEKRYKESTIPLGNRGHFLFTPKGVPADLSGEMDRLLKFIDTTAQDIIPLLTALMHDVAMRLKEIQKEAKSRDHSTNNEEYSAIRDFRKRVEAIVTKVGPLHKEKSYGIAYGHQGLDFLGDLQLVMLYTSWKDKENPDNIGDARHQLEDTAKFEFKVRMAETKTPLNARLPMLPDEQLSSVIEVMNKFFELSNGGSPVSRLNARAVEAFKEVSAFMDQLMKMDHGLAGFGPPGNGDQGNRAAGWRGLFHGYAALIKSVEKARNDIYFTLFSETADIMQTCLDYALRCERAREAIISDVFGEADPTHGEMI